jgi:hypothetical protein
MTPLVESTSNGSTSKRLARKLTCAGGVVATMLGLGGSRTGSVTRPEDNVIELRSRGRWSIRKEMPPTPRPPFDRWPIQAYDPACGFAWYLDPTTLVTQATIEAATVDFARVIQGWIDVLLRERADDVQKAGGLFVFHDWRMVTSYTSEARSFYLERMRSRPRGYMRHSVTCVRAHPLFRMAVAAGNLVAAMTARAKTDIVAEPALALATHGIGAPSATARFPGT